jgi:hypothetical protein
LRGRLAALEFPLDRIANKVNSIFVVPQRRIDPRRTAA